MVECIHAKKISAYHDGELAADQRSEMAAHLATCDRCRAQLDDLTKLSGVFRHAAVPTLRAGALTRIHEEIASAGDRTLQRIATSLTVAAVVLLCAGSVVSWRITNEAVSPASWEDAMVNAITQPQSTAPSEFDGVEFEFAERMIARTAGGGDND